MEPITFTSPDGQHTRVAATAQDQVRMRYNGWQEQPAVLSEPLPDDSAKKAEWVERAEALGVEVDPKMTKAQIQDAVEAKMAENQKGPENQVGLDGAPGVGGATGNAVEPTADEKSASMASKPAR